MGRGVLDIAKGAQDDAGRPARALVFGYRSMLFEAVPALLHRAGFDVVAISTDPLLARHRFIGRFIHAIDADELLAAALSEAATGYELIVPGDDDMLDHLMRAPLDTTQRVMLAPVTSAAHLGHIASKIGLSRALAAAGVPTPDFAVVADETELAAAIERLRGPLMLKADFGSSGRGVIELAGADDRRRPGPFPLLVQEKTPGEVIDLSAFFHAGRLVHFSLSVALAHEAGPFSPSAVRRYLPPAWQDDRAAGRLAELGAALGANGFANVTAVRDAAGQIWFIEADMRPTVWSEYPALFGDDPARAIAASFGTQYRPGEPRPRVPSGPDGSVVLAFGPRMGVWDIVRNRFDQRGHYPNYLGRRVLLDRVRVRAVWLAIAVIRPLLPQALWRWVMRSFAWVFPYR